MSNYYLRYKVGRVWADIVCWFIGHDERAIRYGRTLVYCRRCLKAWNPLRRAR